MKRTGGGAECEEGCTEAGRVCGWQRKRSNANCFTKNILTSRVCHLNSEFPESNCFKVVLNYVKLSFFFLLFIF